MISRGLTRFVSLAYFFFAVGGCGKVSEFQNVQQPQDVDSASSIAGQPSIILFNGTGTSPGDVAALKNILTEHSLEFVTANSQQLNELSRQQLSNYQLLIVPGGNFETIGNNLSSTATTNIRESIRGGLGYLGICAGAFFAGDSPYNGLNLTSGVRFGFYSLELKNIRKAAVAISVAGSSTFDHYWEDGPQLSGWGDVIARYPDGTPAIVEDKVANGWVILSGVHPEAPESWRRGMTFNTTVEVDSEYAATLIDAALNKKRLAHY